MTGALLGLDSTNLVLFVSFLSIVLLCTLDLLGRLGSGPVGAGVVLSVWCKTGVDNVSNPCALLWSISCGFE